MLKVERKDAIQILTLDRADRSNALDAELVSALSGALERTEGDRSVRVVVLTGAGKSFCGGLDLGRLTGLDAESSVEYMRAAFLLFRQVYELRQPIIAAVNGPALAGGFDLAAFCDIRLCSSSATFGQPEILLGLTQIMYPVYKVVGLGHARELALTGRTITAEEAYRIGLVSGVHPREELLAEAIRWAGDLASRPAEALFETKRLSREVIELDTASAMARMFDVISARLRSDEHRAALASHVASLERRRGRQ